MSGEVATPAASVQIDFHRRRVTETGEVSSHFAAKKRDLQRLVVVLGAALRVFTWFALFAVCFDSCDGDVDPVLW